MFQWRTELIQRNLYHIRIVRIKKVSRFDYGRIITTTFSDLEQEDSHEVVIF